MKKPSKKRLRSFILGVLAGLLIFYIVNLIFNWDENVSDYQKGYNAAEKKFENTY